MMFGVHVNSKEIVVAGSAAVVIGFYIRKWILNRKSTLPYPPGPKPHWLLGNIAHFPNFKNGETFDTVILELSKEYGLTTSLNLPIIGTMILTVDPELVKTFMVTKNLPKSKMYADLAPCFGTRSILSVNGKEWADMRKAFNAGFTPTFLKSVVETMAELVKPLIERFEEDAREGNISNMLECAKMYSSAVILAVAFGEEWSPTKPHPARVYEDQVVRLYAKLMNKPLGRFYDWRTWREMCRYGKLVDQEMRAILERRLLAGATGKSKDICSLAIAHFMKDDGTLTEDHKLSIIDQLKTFYFAGHDTTSINLSWSVWLLSQHPSVRSKVRDELEKVGIWNNPDVAPTFEELQECAYLEAVIKETLRLYPPASGLSRNGLENGSYKGYNMKSQLIVVSTYAMHRHPALWKEPDLFRPERFLDGSEADLNSKFVPFSRGPRDCIGRYFAMLEIKLALSAIVSRFDFECIDPDERIEQKLTMVPKNGCDVCMKLRNA